MSLGFATWLGVRLRDPALSITLGLRATWSVKAAVLGDDPYRWAYTSGVLAATLRRNFFSAGLVFEAGTVTTRSDQLLRATLAPGFVAVGLRARAEQAITDLFMLHLSIDAQGVPPPPCSALPDTPGPSCGRRPRSWPRLPLA